MVRWSKLYQMVLFSHKKAIVEEKSEASLGKIIYQRAEYIINRPFPQLHIFQHYPLSSYIMSSYIAAANTLLLQKSYRVVNSRFFAAWAKERLITCWIYLMVTMRNFKQTIIISALYNSKDKKFMPK